MFLMFDFGRFNTPRRPWPLGGKVALLEAAEAGASGGEESGAEASTDLLEVVPKSLEGFDAGMNDDLNTPRYVL